MANWVITNGSTTDTQIATTTAYAGALVTLGSSSGLRRGKVYDVLVGTAGAPADNYMEFAIDRATTISTGAALGTVKAAAALDPADITNSTFVSVNSSVAGITIGSSQTVWYIGMNQRASYRWVCAPGSELVWPATTSAGLALRFRSNAYTGNCTATEYFQEQ